jgi:hypothetical protein
MSQIKRKCYISVLILFKLSKDAELTDNIHCTKVVNVMYIHIYTRMVNGPRDPSSTIAYTVLNAFGGSLNVLL